MLCSVQPAWHLCPPCCGRGVASCPPASSGVSCSPRLPMLGSPVALGLHPPGPAPGPVGLGGIALGPLTGVRPGRLGRGAHARVAPLLVWSFLLLCASLSACSLLCIAAFLLHHALGVCFPCSLTVLMGQRRLASGTATPYKVVLLVHPLCWLRPALPFRYSSCACHPALCLDGAPCLWVSPHCSLPRRQVRLLAASLALLASWRNSLFAC